MFFLGLSKKKRKFGRLFAGKLLGGFCKAWRILEVFFVLFFDAPKVQALLLKQASQSRQRRAFLYDGRFCYIGVVGLWVFANLGFLCTYLKALLKGFLWIVK